MRLVRDELDTTEYFTNHSNNTGYKREYTKKENKPDIITWYYWDKYSAEHNLWRIIPEDLYIVLEGEYQKLRLNEAFNKGVIECN